MFTRLLVVAAFVAVVLFADNSEAQKKYEACAAQVRATAPKADDPSEVGKLVRHECGARPSSSKSPKPPKKTGTNSTSQK